MIFQILKISKKEEIMKGLSLFLGGVAVGALTALLLAPEKGSVTRQRVKDYLKKRGILATEEEIDILVEEIECEPKKSE